MNSLSSIHSHGFHKSALVVVEATTVPAVTVPTSYVASTITMALASTGCTYRDSVSDDGKYIIFSPFMLSIDGGATFNRIPNTSLGGGYYQSTMSFNGMVQVATKNNATYGNYYFSTNYGLTWTTGPGVERYFACFVNDSGSIILACSDQNVYMSTNTGTTWTTIAKATLPGGVSSCSAWSISNSGVYHIRCPYSSSSYFYVSNDSMISWRAFGLLTDSWSYHSCSMSSDGRLQVVNGGIISYVSSDYGATWQRTSTHLELYLSRDGTTLNSKSQISKDFGLTWNTIAEFTGLIDPYNWGICRSPNAKVNIKDSTLYKMAY
jgi:hypothetical protein